MHGGNVGGMTTTAEKAPGLPEVKSLPFLDVAAASAPAAAHVAAILKPAGDDLAERARLAAGAIDRQEKELAEVRARRDAAAWTIENHYHARRAASMSRALGVGRTRWKAIKDRLALNPPAPVPDAPEVLPELAAKTVLLQATVNLLHEHRDEAARALKAATGMTNADVARLIGRDPARVSHLMKRSA